MSEKLASVLRFVVWASIAGTCRNTIYGVAAGGICYMQLPVNM